MMGLVKGRTDQIGHTGVDDREPFPHAILHVDNTRYQRPALGHDRTPELEMELLAIAQLEIVVKNIEVCIEVSDRMLVGMVIIYAEASADIDGFNRYAFLSESLTAAATCLCRARIYSPPVRS